MKKYTFLMNNFYTSFLIISIFLLKIFISHCECGIDTPIFSEGECRLKYCTQSQFDSEFCKIDNKIVKAQWLNDIILFDFDKLRYGSFAMNSNKDMIYECSVEEAKGTRVFYWLKRNGSYFFKDENGKGVSTKIIIVKDETQTDESKKYPIRYESNNIVVSANNKEYLISISLYLGMVEYYDLENNIVSFVSTLNFTGFNIYSTISNLIEIRNNGNKQYLHTLIGRNKDNTNWNNFYLISQIYSFSDSRISLGNGYSLVEQKIIKSAEKHPRIVSSYLTDSNYFVLFYLNDNNKYAIDIYNSSINYINSIEIANLKVYSDEIFFKCIYIKNNLGAFVYYINNNNDCK